MNQSQIDLIEDPPQKSPYFTLPDPQFFVTPEDIERNDQYKITYASLIVLFGSMEKITDDQQTQFLLTLLKHSNFTPDFDAMAQACNIANGNHIRRRFIAIVEKQGFEMEGNTLKNGNEEPSLLTPAREKAVPRTASHRKSKVSEKQPRNTPARKTPGTNHESGQKAEKHSNIVAHTSEALLDIGYADAADVENNE